MNNLIPLLVFAIVTIVLLCVGYLAYDTISKWFVTIKSWASEKLLKRYVVVTDNMIIYCYAYSKGDCIARHYRNYGSRNLINTIERARK